MGAVFDDAGEEAGARYGMGALTYSPLANGVLTGRYAGDAAPDTDSRIGRLSSSPRRMAREHAGDMLNERTLGIAGEVGRCAAELGTTSTAVALAWVRSRPGVTSVIVGPRSLEQLNGNLAGFELELPPDAVARLDEASWTPALTPVNGMRVQHESAIART